jgi:eukaryotic-like serine/threonine-protein kinase
MLPPGFELAGRYRIRKELGRGGMGVVYEADHLSLESEVALKTLHPDLLAEPEAVERFIREARAAASIGHRGIVQVFDLAVDRGITFLAMERLRGEDLRERIKRSGAIPWARALEIGIELAEAISAAHQRGIVHRDLSPGNVFLATDDLGRESVKVLDFGVAKLVEASARELGTRSRETLGTLMYMAPERVNGAANADHRIDIYAIGAVLYEAMTGVPPFASSSYPELALKIAWEQPRPLRARVHDCPRSVVSAIERAMHKSPELRWRSARELAEALSAARDAGVEAPPSAAPNETVDVAALPAVAATPARKRRFALGSVALLIAAPSLGALSLWYGAVTPAAEPERPPTERRARASETSVAPSLSAASGEPAPAGAQPYAMSASVAQLRPALRPRRVVTVVSRPAGAWIAAKGLEPCRAPCALALPADDETLVRGQLSGHRPVESLLKPPLPSRLELRFALQSAPRRRTGPIVGDLPPLLPRR